MVSRMASDDGAAGAVVIYFDDETLHLKHEHLATV